METTAEGIETKGQQDFLTTLGCNEGQGYYFGKPMPAENLSDFISNRTMRKTLVA
jgi:EAL domain-containing protein (putative c-di-GMP-specific phosphodiesterase class I)